MTTTPFFAASALLAALATVSTGASAAELDRIEIDRPVVKVVERDSIDAPIEDVTVVARVIPDPETLTMKSGIKLLNDNIVEAARKACFEADPLEPDDGTCVRRAVRDAKAQIPAVVARAKADMTPTKVAAVG
jgi:hypothetical protein